MRPLHDRNTVIINVGVNTNHSGLISPLYEDGSFFFMPIPEEGGGPDADKDLFPGCPNLPTYEDIKKDHPEVRQCISDRRLGERAHNDPEFDTFTYGDNPDIKVGRGRAANLKNHLRKDEGDLLFFFAGLTSIRDSKKTNIYHFYFVGFFEICDILPHLIKMPTEEELKIFGRNAHIRRGQANADSFNKFWVWKGSDNSQLFSKAVPFDQELGAKILVDSKKREYDWPTDRSDEDLLGSRARVARQIIGDDRKRILLKQVLRAKNDVPLFESIL